MAKQRICKGCGLPFKPITSLQQTHQNFKCYKLWQKSKKKTQLQRLRKIAGKDEDKLRRENDRLFQEVGKLLHPKSIISGEPTEVIHHRIKKSESNFLRYYLPNGVPLTNKEHDAIERRGKTLELEIDAKMGQEWLQDLNEKRKIIFKLTLPYLLEVEIELRKFLKDN